VYPYSGNADSASSIFDPTRWMRWWAGLFSLAPQALTQPILTGWTLAGAVTVNQGNSAAPETEAEVVQRHSYGRQLGRIADALEVLVRERGDRIWADPRFSEFLKMKEEIDQIKLDASADRVRRLRADLTNVRVTRPEEYRRLRDEVRRALPSDQP